MGVYYYDSNNGGGPRPNLLDLRKALVCIIIAIMALLVKRLDTPATNFITSKIKFVVVDYHYDPQRLMATFQEVILERKVLPVLGPAKSITLEPPVPGEINSSFGKRWHPILHEYRMHNGIDISAPEGAPVRAACDGVVLEVVEEAELGRVVRIRHAQGVSTVYAHLKDVYVQAKDHVKEGLIIGSVGQTGSTQGPHLHFEVWQDDQAQDPQKWLTPP